MRDILADIQAKLREGAYQNEEHVRLSLVARILQGLGWDVWNPRQVNAEFAPARTEDNNVHSGCSFSCRCLLFQFSGMLLHVTPANNKKPDFLKKPGFSLKVLTAALGFDTVTRHAVHASNRSYYHF